MIVPRIKQIIDYIFLKYDLKWDKEVKNVLSEKEFLIFDQMDEYDKIHGYKKFQGVKNSKILKDEIIYLKLSLIHDCGKHNIGLLQRLKKVLIGDIILEQHPELGYQKMKELNDELAILIKTHHDSSVSDKMKEFQRIDNFS